MKLKVSIAAIVSMLIALRARAEEPDRERITPTQASKPQPQQDKEARQFIETILPRKTQGHYSAIILKF
jgi:hypothetical protein